MVQQQKKWLLSKRKKKKKARKGVHWQNVRLLEQAAAEGANMGDRNSGSLGSPQSRGHQECLSTEIANRLPQPLVALTVLSTLCHVTVALFQEIPIDQTNTMCTLTTKPSEREKFSHLLSTLSERRQHYAPPKVHTSEVFL